MMIKRHDKMGKFTEINETRIGHGKGNEHRYRHFFFFFFFYDGLIRTEEFVVNLVKREIGTLLPLFVFFFQKTLLAGFSRGSPPSGTRSNEKIYKSSSRNRDLNVSKCPPGEVRNNPRTLSEKISSSGRMASSVSGAQLRQG